MITTPVPNMMVSTRRVRSYSRRRNRSVAFDTTMGFVKGVSDSISNLYLRLVA
jgi:hypothetical protein